MKWNEAKIRYDKLGPKVVENLKKRHFDAYYVSTREEAIEKFFEIVPKDHVVSWGGTCTMDELELKPMLREKGYAVIDRDEAKDMAERMEIMRKALLCDTFVMSSNAISEDGQLFNIDGNGNRVAGTFQGPKKVVFVIGRNKLTKDLESGMKRAKEVASPPNAKRLNKKTPCAVTGKCMDCKSPDRICKVTVLMEGPSMHVDQVHVILVDEDLGY